MEKQLHVQQILASSYLFKSLDKPGREELAQAAQFHEVESGSVLIREGQDGEALYVLEEGRVQVVVHQGEERVLLQELTHGAVFGEVALLTGEPATATVIASEACKLILFPAQVVEDIVSRYPNVKKLLMKVLVYRAQDTVEKLT